MSKKKLKKKQLDTKQKDTENEESIEESIDEVVDDIYDDQDEDVDMITPIRRSHSWLTYLVLTVIVGGVAGIVGELMINNYLYYNDVRLDQYIQPPTVRTASDDQQVIIFKQEAVEEPVNNMTTLLENASQSVVGIYLKRGGQQLSDQLYQPKDKLGNALVLTSDGWLATVVQALPPEQNKELVVMTLDKQLLAVEKIVYDEASQTVFLKIAADNLKVVKFATDSSLYPGLPLVGLSQNLTSDTVRAQNTALAQTRYRLIRGYADYLQSSEQYRTVALLNRQLGVEFMGSPIVDGTGGIIGLYTEIESQPLVVPVTQFMQLFGQLVKYEDQSRPYLGLHYIDLSIARGLPEVNTEGLMTGALVFGDQVAGIVPVIADSPASKAGISLGDIILKVNNDTVDSRHTLTELIQQYSVGDVVKLTIQNGGQTREVEVGLVEIPTE